MKSHFPFSTIGVSKFNPSDPRHIRIKEKRDQYRAEMQQGIKLTTFKDLFFACSKCGCMLAIQLKPGYHTYSSCGQWFQFTYHIVKECKPQLELLKDPAQLSIEVEDPP